LSVIASDLDIRPDLRSASLEKRLSPSNTVHRLCFQRWSNRSRKSLLPFDQGTQLKFQTKIIKISPRKAVSRLHQRVNEHGKRASPIYTGHDDDSAPYENQTLHQLRRIIFPKLKKNLNLLLIAMEPSNFQCDKKSESINSFMDILTDIDTILGELADAMSRIKKNLDFHERALVEDSKIQPVTHFQHSQTRGKVDSFLDHAFSDVLVACDALLIHQAKTLRLYSNGRISPLTSRKATAKIDVMTKWFENSMLNSAREEWRYFLKLIENSLLHLLELSNPRFRRICIDYETESDDMRSLEPGIVVFKLCRLYFDKLSRSTDSNPLILDEPSTCMDREMRVNWQVAEDKYVTIELVGGFIRTSRILWEYYDSMVVKDDPRVYPEVMAEARWWLDSWNSLFLISVANLMGSPVCKWSWRELAAGLDLSNDEVVHDDEWQDRWELANKTELDQKPDGELDK
ncbi:hypothetical protein PSHT_09093, partial [Puccinia striiformis]